MMKRFSLYIIIGVALLFASCNKDNQDNGHLEGFWLMTEKQSGLTWSFQSKLLELRDVTDQHKDIVMSFEHKGGELRVYDPYFVERDSGDIRVTDEKFLIPYGISKTDETFQVIELSSSEMILGGTSGQIKFRKY